AFHDRGEVNVSFTLYGQQLALRLLTNLVVLDDNAHLWPDNALQKNPHRIPLRISFDPRIVEHGRQETFVDQRITNFINVVSQSVASEWNVGLERERLTHGRRVETRDLNIKSLDFGLLAGCDFVSEVL